MNIEEEISKLKEEIKVIGSRSLILEEILRDLFGTIEQSFDENGKLIPTPDWKSMAHYALERLGDETEVVDEQKLVMGEKGTQVAPGCESKSHPSTFTNSNATDSKSLSHGKWKAIKIYKLSKDFKNLIKSVDLRKEKEVMDCNKCDLYGECDYQGPYQKDGKWCYEVEKEK